MSGKNPWAEIFKPKADKVGYIQHFFEYNCRNIHGKRKFLCEEVVAEHCISLTLIEHIPKLVALLVETKNPRVIMEFRNVLVKRSNFQVLLKKPNQYYSGA